MRKNLRRTYRDGFTPLDPERTVLRSQIKAPSFKGGDLTGFTLIELLVVIAIIGLLASVVAASLNNARIKARSAQRKANLRAIITALNLYVDDHNGLYPIAAGTWWCLGHAEVAGNCWRGSYSGKTSLNADLAPYLPQIPDDPRPHGHSPSTTYGDAYAYSSTPDGRSTTLHWYNEPGYFPAEGCSPGNQWVPANENGDGRYCFLGL